MSEPRALKIPPNLKVSAAILNGIRKVRSPVVTSARAFDRVVFCGSRLC